MESLRGFVICEENVSSGTERETSGAMLSCGTISVNAKTSAEDGNSK